MTMDKQQDDAYSYRYYIEAGRTPIRTVYNDKNQRIGAQGFEPKTGAFFIDNGLLSNIRSADVDEVPEDKFYALCQNLFAKSTHRPSGVNGMN